MVDQLFQKVDIRTYGVLLEENGLTWHLSMDNISCKPGMALVGLDKEGYARDIVRGVSLSIWGNKYPSMVKKYREYLDTQGNKSPGRRQLTKCLVPSNPGETNPVYPYK